MNRMVAITWLLVLMLGASVARSESTLRVPSPEPGTFSATIYSLEGEAIGENLVSSVPQSGGGVVLTSTTLVEGRLEQVMEVQLEPIIGTTELRPVWQRIERTIGGGPDRVALRINHVRRQAKCERAGKSAEYLPLPQQDRIANVPMTLLLRPLAAGTVESVDFQMVICERWSRIVGVRVRREGPLVEGAVGMDFRFDIGGPILSTLFRPFLPRINVWMHPDPPNLWIANRVPLHSGGETVCLVREGIDPAGFLDGL